MEGKCCVSETLGVSCVITAAFLWARLVIETALQLVCQRAHRHRRGPSTTPALIPTEPEASGTKIDIVWRAEQSSDPVSQSIYV